MNRTESGDALPPASWVTRMRAEIEEQPQALRATLDALLPRAGEVAALGRDTRQVLFIARGTSDNAMGLSFADLLHGPIAVVDARTPAIIMAADSGPALDGAVALAGRVTKAGATAYGIGGGPALAAACAYTLPGPRLPEWLAPIGLITGGQLLTEALARRLGINPDTPRGLSKVTQTS